MQVRKSFLIGIIIVACFLAYFNTLSAGFVWDDNILIVNNPFIKSFKFLPEYFTHDIWKISGQAVNRGYYRPLLAASFMLDYSFWKDSAFGYHLTNLILHILAGLSVFVFLEMLIKDTLAAFISAMLFILHPIHSESVSFICGRVDILALLCFMLGLVFFIRSARSPKKGFFVIPGLFFFLGLLFKETTIVLPLIVLVTDYLYLSQGNIKEIARYLFKRYAGFLVAFLLYMVFRLLFTKFSFLALNKQYYMNYSFGSGNLWWLFTPFLIIAKYVRLLFFPINLKADYFFQPASGFFDPAALCGAVLAGLSLYIFIRHRKKNKIIALSVAWFFIAILPVLNLIPSGNIFAERYLYLPSLGFCMAIGVLFSRILQVTLIRKASNARILTGIILFLLFFTYGSLTFERSKFWQNDHTLWLNTAEASPLSSRAHLNLANVYLSENSLDKAWDEAKFTLKLSPGNKNALVTLGLVLFKKGKPEDAINKFEEAIRADSEDCGIIYGNIAMVFNSVGKYQEAVVAGEKAIKENPYLDKARLNLAFSYVSIGNISQAIRELEDYILINPRDAAAVSILGKLYYKSGDLKKASAYKTAVRKIIRN